MNRLASTISGMATEKVSITLDADVLAELREQVGPRGLSAYINDTLRAELKREQMRHLLREQDEEFGPVPPEVIEEARRELWED